MMLLGQRHFRRNSIVSGTQIMEGLRDSGFKILRADMFLKKHMRSGTIIGTGIRRTLRYQLSTDGLNRAEVIARRLLAAADEKPD